MILLAEARTFYQTTPHDFNFDGCVYALIALLKAKCSLSQTYYEILQILSVTVFEKTPIFSMFAGENYTSVLRDNPNQLKLFDL